MFGRKKYRNPSSESYLEYESTGIRRHLETLETKLFDLKEILPVFDIDELSTPTGRSTQSTRGRKFVAMRYYCEKTMFTPSRLIEWAWVEIGTFGYYPFDVYVNVANTFGKPLGTFTIYSSETKEPITAEDVKAFSTVLHRTPYTKNIIEEGFPGSQYNKKSYLYFVVQKNSPYSGDGAGRIGRTKKCAAEGHGLFGFRAQEISDFEKVMKKDDARQNMLWGKHVYDVPLPPETYYKSVPNRYPKPSASADSESKALGGYY